MKNLNRNRLIVIIFCPLELPSFWEFVRYLQTIPLQEADEHWTPQTHYCSMCAIKYDFIIKFENIKTEMPFFWERLNLTEKVSKHHWANPEHSEDENSILLIAYFSLLSHEDIEWLKSFYKYDFDILDYSTDI